MTHWKRLRLWLDLPDARYLPARIIGNPLSLCCLVVLLLWAMHYRLGISFNSSLFAVVSLTAGWIVAFQTSRWNQAEGLAQQLRFDGYRAISQQIFTAEHRLVSLQATCNALTTRVDYAQNHILKGLALWNEFPEKIAQTYRSYHEAYILMLGLYQQHEILFLRLSRFKDALFDENEQFGSEFSKFHSSLLTIVAQHGSQIPANKKITDNIVKSAHSFSERCGDIISYLHDFRIELQNYSLGRIVGKQVPHRKPTDPKYKTLVDLEAVWSEEQRLRDIEAAHRTATDSFNREKS